MAASLDLQKAKNFTKDLEKQVGALWPDVTFCTIVHRRGQRNDAAEAAFAKLDGHPALESVRQLWRGRSAGAEHSSFLGLALGRTKGFMGFGRRDELVSLMTINIDQYANTSDALFDLYHLTGQAVELIEHYKGVQNHSSLKEGPLRAKRNQLGESRANLRADIFSALMMSTLGAKDAPTKLARKRGIEALTASALHSPEHFPYPLATETTQYAVERFLGRDGGERSLQSAHKLALNVTRTFDENNIRTWWDFTNPSQAMAWTGTPMERILGAAVHTCPDPFIKATGYLVSEIVSIPAASGGTLGGLGYNPFVSVEINRLNHERQIEETFEMVLAHGIETESSMPLLRFANQQNEGLTSGKVMGWCAQALQSSAKAFDHARARGLPAERAARLEFQGTNGQADWATLHRLNEYVTNERRNGYAVTLSSISEYAQSDQSFKPFYESVNTTMKDPHYQQRLEAVTQPAGPAMGPSIEPAAAPSVAPSVAPAMGMAPGMGMGGGGGVRTRPVVRKKPEQEGLQLDEEEKKKK